MGLIQNALRPMKYFDLETEAASSSFTPHLRHPKASSLLLLHGFGSGERTEENQGRGKRARMKSLGKAVPHGQASCADVCSDQTCDSALSLLNIYSVI